MLEKTCAKILSVLLRISQKLVYRIQLRVGSHFGRCNITTSCLWTGPKCHSSQWTKPQKGWAYSTLKQYYKGITFCYWSRSVTNLKEHIVRSHWELITVEHEPFDQQWEEVVWGHDVMFPPAETRSQCYNCHSARPRNGNPQPAHPPTVPPLIKVPDRVLVYLTSRSAVLF